jgi:anti-sigma regulatory factor (Ser/Thr protein kinase)
VRQRALAGVPAAGVSGPSGLAVPAPPSGYRGIVPGDWPLQDTLELGSLPGAVPCARLHVRHVLWEWGMSRCGDNAELLVSELMTNAVAALEPAGQVFPVRLWLMSDQMRVLILVWDASLRPPIPGHASQDAEGGRGLLLVEAVSQRWDWYFPREAGGKVVWAIAACEDD